MAVRASILAELGRGDEAASELRKLLDGKNDRETYITLAQVHDKSKNYAEMAKAIDAAEKLSETGEEKESVFFMRGAMLEKRKDFDAAEAEFRKVLELNPKNASALNYLGYMLAERGQRNGDDIQAEEKVLPEHTIVYGPLQFAVGRGDDSDVHMDGLAAAEPDECTVLQHLEEL